MPRHYPSHTPHSDKGLDTPKPAADPPPAYKTFEESVLAGDMKTADFWFNHNNYTHQWLTMHIEGMKEVSGHYDASQNFNPWTNNRATSEYATRLYTAYQAYEIYRFG